MTQLMDAIGWSGGQPECTPILRFVTVTSRNLGQGIRVLRCAPRRCTARLRRRKFLRTKARDEARAEFGLATDAVVIIQVSRLEEWKGQRFLLEALGRSREVHNWTCWIVGGAQRRHEAFYLETLQTDAVRLGIGERVKFLGQRSDIARLLAAADVFCQPNTGPEPFGIVFVEALYAGLPVVTSDIGGAREVVDESCGMLFKAGDVDQLSRVLTKMVREPQVRRRLGAQGPIRAHALCDPSRQLAQLRGTFERMLSSSASEDVSGNGRNFCESSTRQ